MHRTAQDRAVPKPARQVATTAATKLKGVNAFVGRTVIAPGSPTRQ